VGCEQNIQSADDVVSVVHDELSKPSIKDWVGSGTRLRVEKLDCTRDWRGHLPSLGIKLEGGLLRDDTGNHFFLSMMRRGWSIMTHEEIEVLFIYTYIYIVLY
jgi:hypothetical protein